MPIMASLMFIGCVNLHGENEKDLMKMVDPDSLVSSINYGTTALTYSSPDLPTNIEFAGDDIELRRFDRRERIDREMMAFTYMHSSTLQMLKRANRFFPVVEPILKENGIPDDLKYLMVIESNVDPTARSGAGAAGLWQFMPATAKEYGLEVNSSVDERYNIEKATAAACRYLKKAYDKYGDWASVAASYNAGQGRITSQLSRQNVTNSLDLHLVEETARYVYRILAAKALFSNPAEYGFRLRDSDLYPEIESKKITVTTGIPDLSAWANEQGINLAILKIMNPWLRDTSLVNNSGKEYVITVPTEKGIYYNPAETKAHDKNWVIEE